MLLALDVGFANMGWAVFDKSIPIQVGLIQTEKSTKTMVRVSDDNVVRVLKLARGLKEVIAEYHCQGVVGELPHGGAQSAKASRLMGVATGVVGAVVGVLDLPAEWCLPSDVKKVIGGRINVSKDEIMDSISKRYGWVKEKKGRSVVYTVKDVGWVKGKFEHIADACGAYLSLRDGNMVKMFG